ncbi:phosphotransferase-like protein [Ruegeria halocynthiae]|uniref:phosphotransferase-like protein n=1 Tax=Ruegeria halocynthiae TaxID=985054 RepID=UPI003CCC16C2
MKVLEERERRRGDRSIGLSRWQYKRVHEGMTYDLLINTESKSPLACAKLIKTSLNL